MKRNFGTKMQQAAAHQPALKHNFAWTTLSSGCSGCMIQIHLVDVWGGQITAIFISQKESMISSVTVIVRN